ncbi:MAG: hypothetical protein HY649_09545, partial [Acidobacteria bacterium]|nr:hypothetical protein [Acidobacteriota bacterium]
MALAVACPLPDGRGSDLLMTQTPLRIAAVSYLNAVPLVWGLVHGPQRGRFRVEFMVPSRCADALREGSADAGVIPSIEYQRIE